MLIEARRLIILTLLILLFVSTKTLADSVNFTASVGDTILILRGFTSPNSQVTFQENNSVKGTTQSLTDGSFEKTFTAQDEGLHTISIYSTDPVNHNTSVLEKDIFLIPFQSTEINDIILPASVQTDQSSYTTGPIIVSGYSKPEALIKINVKKNNGEIVHSIELLSDSSGYYEYTFSASSLESGIYKIDVTVKDSLGADIVTSTDISFIIEPRSSEPSQPPNVPPPAPPQDQPPENEPSGSDCIYRFPKLCLFDKTQKGELDFSIDFTNFINGFSFYYKKGISNDYDINNDGDVTAEDLSIVLHYTQSDATYEPINPEVKESDNFYLNFILTLIKYQLIVGTIAISSVFTLSLVLRRIYLKRKYD